MEYKINTTLPIQFEKIENPPYLNDSRFQAVRIYVAHEKDNYNGSWFDVSVLEKMGRRMAGVPIVGYISTNNLNERDFNGHEERLVIENGDIKIEYLGRAYGCVLSNNDVSIVERLHESGEMRKYLCVTGVLWKMFSDCIDIFNRNSIKPHSMELQEDSISGKFEKDGYYHFNDATVRALCILGDDVNSAMSNSIIEKFSLQIINSSIQELLNEVNESIKQFSKQNHSSENSEVDNINTDKGGIEVEENKEFETEVVETEVIEETTETVETAEVTEESTSTESTEGFEQTEETVEENTEVDFESIKQEYENTISDLNTQIENLKSEYSTLESETKILREFKANVDAEKRQIAETELFSQYEEKLNGVEEFETLKTNASNYSIEDLEKECALLFVKKTQNFSLNKTQKTTIKIGVNHSEDKDESPYGGLFEKYLHK